MSTPAGRRPVVALVVDAVYPWSWGGRELRYSEYGRRLGQVADLHVFTMHWWPGTPVHRDGAVTFHAVSPLIPMYGSGRRSITHSLRFALACFRLLGHDFDVLEADHMPYLHLFVLRLVAILKRRRLVVTWHEVWGREYWRTYVGRAGIGAWIIEWLSMRLPDHIVAASPQTAQRLRAILGRRAAITVAPNGIDVDTIRSTLPADTPTDLVVVGRLIEHKRVDMLLEAVALLRASGTDVTCRVVGDGPDRDALHARADELGVGEAVEFRHDVREQKDLYALVKAARVFVSPSEREGFGIAVLEALACGLPVIMTSAPDNLARHLVAQSARGTICDHSAAALAQAVSQVLARQPDAAAQPGAPAELWLEEYTWDAMTRQIREALQI